MIAMVDGMVRAIFKDLLQICHVRCCQYNRNFIQADKRFAEATKQGSNKH